VALIPVPAGRPPSPAWKRRSEGCSRRPRGVGQPYGMPARFPRNLSPSHLEGRALRPDEVRLRQLRGSWQQMAASGTARHDLAGVLEAHPGSSPRFVLVGGSRRFLPSTLRNQERSADEAADRFRIPARRRQAGATHARMAPACAVHFTWWGVTAPECHAEGGGRTQPSGRQPLHHRWEDAGGTPAIFSRKRSAASTSIRTRIVNYWRGLTLPDSRAGIRLIRQADSRPLFSWGFPTWGADRSRGRIST